MKLLNTIVLSSSLVLSLCAMEKSSKVIEYDKENGFIYYEDGSVFMIEDDSSIQENSNELEIVEPISLQTNTTSLQQAVLTEEEGNLEIIQTIPLDQNIATTSTSTNIEIQHTIVAQPIITHTTQPCKTCKPIKKRGNSGKFIGNIKLLHVLDGKENGYDSTTGSAYYVNAGYQTPSVNGFSAKVTGYIVGDTGLTETDSKAKIANGQFMGEKTKDKTTILKTKANIQEAYVKYKSKALKAQVGHFTLNTPMTKNTTSTVPNLYEGALVSSKAIVDDTIVVGSHITKMAYGARAISDWSKIAEKSYTGGSVKVYGSAVESLAAGDESLPKIRRGKYTNLGKLVGKDDTSGMTIVGAINKSVKNTTIQAWEYIIYDVANITYVDGMAKFKLANGVKTMIGAQLMHQNIKDEDGNPTLIGLKTAASYKGAKLILAINKSNGDAMLNIWGGDPAYTSMVHSKNAYRPDVTAIKLVGKYKLSNLHNSLPKNLSLVVAYGEFGKSSLKNAQKDASETDIALKYKPKKNLLFKLANVQRTTEQDGFKGKDKTQNMTKFVMKYKF